MGELWYIVGMDSLNRNQFFLLILLVSFVTSIATGIMTFALLQEAPVEITRTINQVVEKTIQQVTPATGILSSSPKEVTTVVVKEEDLVLDSINKNLKSIVRVRESYGTSSQSRLYGIGLVINTKGDVVVPRDEIVPGNSYFGILSDGTEIQLNPMGADAQTRLVLFTLLKPDAIKANFVPATFADVEPWLGQTVVTLGGETENAVSVGRVESFVMKEENTASTTTKYAVKYIGALETTVSSKNLEPGSPLFTLAGDIVGIQFSREKSVFFTPVSIVKKELNLVVKP